MLLPEKTSLSRAASPLERTDDTLLFMTSRVTMTEGYEMPIVAPLATLSFSDLRAYHRLKKDNLRDIIPHFYVSDQKNKQAFFHPFRTKGKLSRFDTSIATDFSMTQEMSRPQKVYSSFLNKLWAAWLQSYGMRVIPNVSWPYEYQEDYWLEGWPKNSIIAVSSVGISHGDVNGWLEGMERVWDELCPLHVIRYGSKVPEERTDNCTFIKNDNNRFANGRE